jgi:hypothetical protein
LLKNIILNFKTKLTIKDQIAKINITLPTSHRKTKKIGFSVRFRLNRYETENETENTKKPIYKTETETEKTEKKTKPKPKKGLFSKINFLNVEKSIINVFLFSKFYYFHTKNLLWQSILHLVYCTKLKLELKVLNK